MSEWNIIRWTRSSEKKSSPNYSVTTASKVSVLREYPGLVQCFSRRRLTCLCWAIHVWNNIRTYPTSSSMWPAIIDVSCRTMERALLWHTDHPPLFISRTSTMGFNDDRLRCSSLGHRRDSDAKEQSGHVWTDSVYAHCYRSVAKSSRIFWCEAVVLDSSSLETSHRSMHIEVSFQSIGCRRPTPNGLLHSSVVGTKRLCYLFSFDRLSYSASSTRCLRPSCGIVLCYVCRSRSLCHSGEKPRLDIVVWSRSGRWSSR